MSLSRLTTLPLLLAAGLSASPSLAAPLAGNDGSPALPIGVRTMFVTSATGTGKLHDWADSGGATGVAAGDAICQAAAAAGSLQGPSLYRAWLSDSTTDAFCHVQGLTGKRSDDCGQDPFVPIGGPWQRVDGKPFAATLAEMLEPNVEVYMPPRVDEHGHIVHGEVWTGSADGALFPSDACADWTSASNASTANAGTTDATGGSWEAPNHTGPDTCNADNHLYCFQTGLGAPLPPFAGWGRLAFVTAAQGTGKFSSWLGGLPESHEAAADEICRISAASLDLPYPESFKAWISTSLVDAKDRFANDGPWIRPDRIRIANDLADLTDGYLRSPISQTESGNYLGGTGVWTGTSSDGTAGALCGDDWDSSNLTPEASTGDPSKADGTWTEWPSIPEGCGHSFHLYCLQDLPLVFGDGFESGTTELWSQTAP